MPLWRDAMLGVWSGGEWVALQVPRRAARRRTSRTAPSGVSGREARKLATYSETTRVVVLTAHNPMGRSRDAAANDAATQTLVRACARC